jgi:hypothetical protein
MSGLAEFMAAVRRVESGDPKGDYQARGKPEGGLVPRGAYGFTNWSQQASAAGYPDANLGDYRAQDRVAANHFNRLHQKFGNWDLVALAWFTNEKVAEQVAEGGYSKPGQFKNKTVRAYIESVKNAYSEAEADDNVYNAPIEMDESGTGVPHQYPEGKRPAPSEMMATFVEQLSASNAGGQRTHINDLAPKRDLEAEAEQAMAGDATEPTPTEGQEPV